MTAFRRGSSVLHVLLAVALLVIAPAARAQVQAVTPYYAVVIAEDAMLRCDAREAAYPVARLTKGQVLRVDGEGTNWARVAYPPTAAALIPADSFQLDANGRSGTVTRSVRVKAFNMTTGVRGSWKDASDAPVAPGAKLTVIDPAPATDSRGTWYKVGAPETARGYVQVNQLRRATQDEVNSALANQAVTPADQGRSPETAAPGTGQTPPGTTGQPAPTGRDLTQPMVPPTPRSGEQPVVQPPASPDAAGTPSGAGDAGAPAVAPIEVRPVEIPPSPYEKLEAAFEAVRKQPPEQAEYTELMAELQKAIDDLDDSPQSQVIRPRLQHRLEYLRLLADIREQQRKLAEAQSGLRQNDELIRKRLEELDRVRQYTIVGRLSASTLYDGKRLPLMYRLQSVGGTSPRTLAYIKPDPKLGIDRKLGQVVGVVGDSTIDPALRLNIITPLRVDTLEAAETPPTGPSEAAPAAGDQPRPGNGG